MDNKIDFVISYLDGTNPDWIKERSEYLFGLDKLYDPNEKYINWENLQYLFRGIEKFAPFVNKIHFITDGHLPDWLNVNHPKLNIVKHSEYIPEVFLPTFSNIPVEINVNKIKDLNENFVYFNDNMFLTNFVEKEDFFVDGKPVDIAVENPVTSNDPYDMFPHILLNCVGVINKNFDKKVCIEKHKELWNSSSYTEKQLAINSKLSHFAYFSGFSEYKLPQSFKKSIIDEAWKKEEIIFTETSSHKFRTVYDVNQYAFRYWQIASGNISVRKEESGKYFKIEKESVNEITDTIKKQSYKTLCLDDAHATIKDFENVKKAIHDAFESILPNKSKFEI